MKPNTWTVYVATDYQDIKKEDQYCDVLGYNVERGGAVGIRHVNGETHIIPAELWFHVRAFPNFEMDEMGNPKEEDDEGKSSGNEFS